MSKRLIIVRGPSGVGKSRFVAEQYPEAHVFNTDHFFETCDDGAITSYKFDVTKLSAAHSTCMQGVLRAIQSGVPQIVVENSFTHRWEWWNYDLAARLAGYEVEMIELLPQSFRDVQVCTMRNGHGTPLETIYKMACEFEHCSWARVLAMVISDEERHRAAEWFNGPQVHRCEVKPGGRKPDAQANP